MASVPVGRSRQHQLHIYDEIWGAHTAFGKAIPPRPLEIPQVKEIAASCSTGICSPVRKGREGLVTFPGGHQMLPHNGPTTLLLPLVCSPNVETRHLSMGP